MTKPSPIHPLIPSVGRPVRVRRDCVAGQRSAGEACVQRRRGPDRRGDCRRHDRSSAGGCARVGGSLGVGIVDHRRWPLLLCGLGAGIHGGYRREAGIRDPGVPDRGQRNGEPVALPMRPDPVLLEGLEIVSDRFERRRRAVATSVRAFDEETIASSGYWSAADFVDLRAGVITTPCGMSRCVYYRGQRVSPRVYLDEFPLMGGGRSWRRFRPACCTWSRSTAGEPIFGPTPTTS